MRQVRALIKQAAPKAVEEKKWGGVPTWSLDGIICTGETYQKAVKLTFPKGAKINDPKKLFNASLDGNVRRAIDIREGDKLNATAFKTLIRAAVALNKKKPSKSKPKPGPKGHYDWDVTEAELVAHLDEELKDAWEKLRAFAAELGAQRIYASIKSIMFSRKYCYFFVRPQKKHIEVWIFLPRKIDGLKAVQGSSKQVKYSNLYKLTHADQVEEPLTDWIREAYDFAPAS